MKLRDLVALSAIVLLAIGFLLPVRALSQERKDEKVACANNLKQIALAVIQYADDKRFFPHLGKATELDNKGDSTPKGSDVSPRCLRSLIFFNYHDSPGGFCCQASTDEAKQTKEAKEDIRAFGWMGEVTDKSNPIQKAGKNDKDADALTDLSYGWTLRAYTSNSRSNSKIVADRAAQLGSRSKQKLRGNHSDGWNVACVDAHVDYVKTNGDDAKKLSAAGKTDPALAVWDEANAGEKVEEKKDDSKKDEKKK